MNFDDILKTWQSPHNRPSPAALEEQKMKLVADLRRRRRGTVLFLCLVAIPLVFLTGKVAFHVLWPDPAFDRVDFAREWGIVPLFALPWLGWLVLVWLHRRHRARHANHERSIAASVAALLDEAHAECARYKVIAALLVASVVLLPLIVFQLRAAGKAGDEILIPAFVIYPAYVLLLLAWFAFHYRLKLLPRRRELEALLASYR